jgi:hypothetical protein
MAPRKPQLRYELFYGTNGHGGPYSTPSVAVNWARQLLLGSKSLRVIFVKPYGPQGYDAPIATVRKQADGTITVSSAKGVRIQPSPLRRAHRLLRRALKLLDRDFHAEASQKLEKEIGALLREYRE